jgi:thymidylate synthase
MRFKTATDAFECYYKYITLWGRPYQDTLAIFNRSFTIINPFKRIITTPWRNFSESYAQREWEWYTSGDRSVESIAKFAPMWNKMADESRQVWSNYGWWWHLNAQLEQVIKMLQDDMNTRRAIVVHYNPMWLPEYNKDTPCNLVLNFYVADDELNLTVFARSIDLWFGFCNDQYQFSKLLELVGARLNMPVGQLHYFITNLHLYNKDIIIVNK